MKNKNDFEFKYSAPTAEERKQIESIKNSYTQTETNEKFEELKKLDHKVKRLPKTITTFVGIVGTLVFGLGLSMILEWNLLLFGVLVAALGTAVCIANYFVFKAVSNKLKNKYSAKIIELSNELLSKTDK